MLLTWICKQVPSTDAQCKQSHCAHELPAAVFADSRLEQDQARVPGWAGEELTKPRP